MKIQCDVCNKGEASVFCTADEAALCDGCDHRVHHANKLASKHQRFSLHRPSTKQQQPLCDICKERRAFMFCQQDRAILCKECDFPIHSANEHTKKHNRFLLTGVKLSDISKIYSSTPPSNNNSSSNNDNTLLTKTATTSSIMVNYSKGPSESTTPPISGGANIEGGGSTSTSSISEYLIETIPGWQVEDFLDYSSNSALFGFSKNDEMLPIFCADLEDNLVSFSTENMGIWVPQAPPPPLPPSSLYPSSLYPSQMLDHRHIGLCETKEATTTTNTVKGGSNKSRLRDDNFIVPQISPNSIPKRSRFLW